MRESVSLCVCLKTRIEWSWKTAPSHTFRCDGVCSQYGTNTVSTMSWRENFFSVCIDFRRLCMNTIFFLACLFCLFFAFNVVYSRTFITLSSSDKWIDQNMKTKIFLQSDTKNEVYERRRFSKIYRVLFENMPILTSLFFSSWTLNSNRCSQFMINKCEL